MYSSENMAGEASSRKRKLSQLKEKIPEINIENEEDLLIMKNLNVLSQKETIKNLLKKTLKLRIQLYKSNKIKKFSIEYPFYFTSPDLVRI